MRSAIPDGRKMRFTLHRSYQQTKSLAWHKRTERVEEEGKGSRLKGDEISEIDVGELHRGDDLRERGCNIAC